jgi:hypothetical protein
MQAAMTLQPGKRGGRRQQLSTWQLAVAVADGCPHLHPTTKLVLPQVTTIHTFSGNAKLCFIWDEKSGKDFLVDTGATLSLIPFQSAAAATGPQLQAVNKQAIKTWNFVKIQQLGIYVHLFKGGRTIPNCWFGFFAFFWDAGQPLLPRDSYCTLPAHPGRGHRRRQGFKFPSFLFFGPERGPSASAESRCRCSPYSH